MKNIKMLGLAAVAAMAAMAFMGVASASAFTVWQDNGSNVTASEATTIVPSTANPLKLHDSFNGVTVTCSSGTGGGTVNTGGADTVTSGSDTNCTSSNTFLCSTPVTATAVNGSGGTQTVVSATNPWNTQISGTRDNITNSTNNPGWKTVCHNGLSVTCTSASSSQALSNDTSVSPNRVISTFDALTPTGSCTDGGTGTVTGSVWITLNNGHNLSVA